MKERKKKNQNKQKYYKPPYFYTNSLHTTTMTSLRAWKTLLNNFFFRSKKLLVLFLLVICALILIKSVQDRKKVVLKPVNDKFDLVSNRINYINPIYQRWIESGEYETLRLADLSQKCNSYFDHLSKISESGSVYVDLELMSNFDFNIFLYKKKKWFREKTKRLRKNLMRKGSRFDENYHSKQLEIEFDHDIKELASFEYQTMREMNDARVFGKCFIENSIKDCRIHESKTLPWLNKEFPKFENWKLELLPKGELPVFNESSYSSGSSDCFINQLLAKSNGKGIVIPLLPTSNNNRQIDNTIRLINVLRGLKNTFPIEIVYLNNFFNQVDKRRLIEAARTEIRELPSSHHEYLKAMNLDENFKFSTPKDFPKQDIWFVDISNVKNKDQHPLISKSFQFNNPTFTWLLSTIFNSFEESVVLLPTAVPVVEIEHFFQMEKFREYGYLFFKKPSYYRDNKARKFAPGFHETTNFIKSFLMPNRNDQSMFGIRMRQKKLLLDTNRFLEDNFATLMDPTLLIINKPKIINSLLLGCNLQMYKILESRIQISSEEVNPEIMWLSQEMSGNNEKIAFNRHFGVLAGQRTPYQNKNYFLATAADEYCSSSFGQLDEDDDHTLLYLTSDQLEHWVYQNPESQTILKSKFIITKNESHDLFGNGDQTNVLVDSTEIYDNTINKNPLYVDEVLNPPVIKNPILVQGFREPDQAWDKVYEFSDGGAYWCAYNLVGSIDTPMKGKEVQYNEKLKAWFNYVLDLWLM